MVRQNLVSGFFGSCCMWLFVGGIGDGKPQTRQGNTDEAVRGVIRARRLEVINQKGDVVFYVDSKEPEVTLQTPDKKSSITMFVNSEQAIYFGQVGEGLQQRIAVLGAFRNEAQMQLKSKGDSGVRKYRSKDTPELP